MVGSVRPETTASPNPYDASITSSSANGRSGFSVSITPADVGTHHPLEHQRDAGRAVHPLLPEVRRRTVLVDRSPALLDRLGQGLQRLDGEDRLVDAGKRCAVEVLSHRGAAHRPQ